MGGGETLTVLDLRELFCLDEALPTPESLMLVIVQYRTRPFAFLADGLLDIHDVSKDAIRSFISLYVGGVKWLSGAVALEDHVVSLLDLDVLDRLAHADNGFELERAE